MFEGGGRLISRGKRFQGKIFQGKGTLCAMLCVGQGKDGEVSGEQVAQNAFQSRVCSTVDLEL